MAADLHAVLTVAGVPGPFVLVGHSLGGLTLRIFAQQYPHEVAGMVLVDAAHPDLFRRQLAEIPPATPDEAPALTQWRHFLSVQVLDPATYPEPLDWLATEAQVRAVGNARPLDQALQHATTEMARWLVQDMALDPAIAYPLMGMCVRYDVGNVVNPAYTVVCKMAKHVLQSRLGTTPAYR